MSRLRIFKDKMQVPLDLKDYKKMEKKELFEEQKKQEDLQYNVYYIKGNFHEYYQELEILGEGCVGLVKKVKRISDGQIFASKMVKTKDDEEVVLNVIREFKNQRELHHPNIVEVYELYVDETKGRIYTIMELVEAKEMFDVISKLGQYSEKTAAHIFKQILAAIDYLHEHMVCHRDLKPNNILCNEDGTCVKITDFNVSKFAHYDNAHKKASTEEGRQQVLMWTYTGTVAFSAPEIFDGDSYDQSVDMWSAGVVLYTMLVGHQPFEAEYVQDLIKMIQTGDYSFPSNISENAKDLIQKCLQIDPKQRIKPTEALAHAWIQDKQNTQPLQEVSNKININLKKLISKFAAYRNLGLIRKISKRKSSYCTSLLYKIRDSSPSAYVINYLNEQDRVKLSAEPGYQNRACLITDQPNISQQQLGCTSLTYVDQTSGYDEQTNQNRSSFSLIQNQQMNGGFSLLEHLSSEVISVSDLNSINNLDDDQDTSSLEKTHILQKRSSNGSEQLSCGIRRTRRSAQTNIIHNRYKLSESDQLIVQTIESDQLSQNNYSLTTQDLSESDQILCNKIYYKLNPDEAEGHKFNKIRVNSLCNIQSNSSNMRISPQPINNQQSNNSHEIQQRKSNVISNRINIHQNTQRNKFNPSSKSKFASITSLNINHQEATPYSYQSLSDNQIKTSVHIDINENYDKEETGNEDFINNNSNIKLDTSLGLID